MGRWCGNEHVGCISLSVTVPDALDERHESRTLLSSASSVRGSLMRAPAEFRVSRDCLCRAFDQDTEGPA